MARLTRRETLAAFGLLGLGTAAGLGYLLRGGGEPPAARIRLTEGGGFMGTGPVDMRRYMEMFRRHNEIRRVVDEIPGGVRTTTESNAPELVAQLQAHVSSMYDHLDQGVEVVCMSSSLPTMFRGAGAYRRRMTLTPNGVVTEETSEDPALTAAIREHAREVTGFVEIGMPAMMGQMMGGGGMGPGGMMGPGG
ncbi:hypothetical protein, partial [Mycolicibacterium palauense]|uniref:hypothetical protein n=1 Tax=Mycolicibacterium palauense TaxID=2034511 RepID=UPI000BFEE86C